MTSSSERQRAEMGQYPLLPMRANKPGKVQTSRLNTPSATSEYGTQSLELQHVNVKVVNRQGGDNHRNTQR